jgi:hypothetical protein
MIHTYRLPPTSAKFEVGYWYEGLWTTLSTHTDEKLAIKRVNALNGGDGSPDVWDDP